LVDGMRELYAQRARVGLTAGAAELQATMRQTTAYNDDTGATRAGTVAYVVGPGETGGAALAVAVAAVERENPGRSATARGSIGPGTLGVVATIPTDYQRHLEVERAGAHAVIGPAMEAHANDLTRHAAEGR
jgi:hypothetical protein